MTRTETSSTPITCKGAGCQQVLAVRWRNGSVKPISTDVYVDEYKRVVVHCPACGTRNRIPIQKHNVA